MPAGQEFEEDGGVKDQVPPAAKSCQRGEQSQNIPIRRCTGHDGEYTAHEQRAVEGEFASDHICAKSPEQGTDQHAGVGGDGECVGKRRLELEGSLPGSHGLQQQNQGVGHIAESVQEEESHVQAGPSDLINSLSLVRPGSLLLGIARWAHTVQKAHLRVEGGIGFSHGVQLTLLGIYILDSGGR